MKFFELVERVLASPEAYIAFLQDIGLILRTVECSCGNKMQLRSFKRAKDKHIFRCLDQKCLKALSIRKSTWFENSKLELRQILMYIFCFVNRVPTTRISLFTDITGKHTLSDYGTFCREICLDYVYQNCCDIVGGKGIIVEIDESKFGKRKYRRGRRVDGQWVLGGIERGENPGMFFVCVEKRDRETLETVLSRHIKPGTRIISDCWKAYNELGLFDGYEHETVNHSKHFVDPDNPDIHTNTVESTWRALKASLPRYGVRKEKYYQGSPSTLYSKASSK